MYVYYRLRAAETVDQIPIGSHVAPVLRSSSGVGGLSRDGICTPPPTWHCARPMQCDIIGHEGPSSHAMHPRLHRVAIYSADTQYSTSCVAQSVSQSAATQRDRWRCQCQYQCQLSDAVSEQHAGGQKLPCVFGNLHVRRRADAATGKNVISSAIQLLLPAVCWCCYLDPTDRRHRQPNS